MQEKGMNLKQWTIIVLILCWLGWHLAVPVDFVRSDLGRHIKNGELILHGNWDVLYKNFYSYTNPEYPFINHHWFFGVFCYVLWHLFGFTGLSFIYLIIELLTFYLFFRIGQKYSSFPLACAFGLLSIPFLCFRTEMRPEGISYLFCGLYWFLIDAYQQKRFKSHHLIITLGLLQLIWVNTHIFFIMGPVLTLLFWWQANCNREKQQAELLQTLFFVLLLMCFINPSGIEGFLAPFHVNKAYLISIVENQSVFYLLTIKDLFFKSVLIYFLVAAGLLIAALFFLIQREGFKKYILIGSLSVFFSFVGMKAERLIEPFGFFWISLSMYVCYRLIAKRSAGFKKSVEIALVVLGIIVSAFVNVDWKQKHGLGIVSGSNEAAEFFKQENISSPIFNNYDVGGYLIFHLFPQHQLFIDNRMEAFPGDFLKNTYNQMQWDDDLWQKMDRDYNFNAIFVTVEASKDEKTFLTNRLADFNWALVYVKDGAMIFLKRNTQNAGIIRRCEIHTQGKSADDYYDRGINSYNQGNLTQAISDYDKVIELDPKYAKAYNNRGNIYSSQGNLTQALSDYNKAIESDSKYVEAYINRGVIYFKQGKLTQALTEYNKAIELNPNYAQVYFNRGNIFYNQGKFVQALSDYNKVIDINPKMGEVFGNRAIVYYQLKKFDLSKNDVHKAEELGASVNPALIKMLGQISIQDRINPN